MFWLVLAVCFDPEPVDPCGQRALYTVAKPGRIDNEARRGLESLRYGRSSAHRENLGHPPSGPAQLGDAVFATQTRNHDPDLLLR